MAATKTAPPQETTTMNLPRRERHLDFMDASTLAYYLGLDPDTGERLSRPPPPSDATHGVAVMFYAQWDHNSHQLAPIWDRIGQMTHAGTKTSGLLLGLFDCEFDQRHLRLCHAAGVTHYPTLLYMSPSRTFPHKPGLFKHNHHQTLLPHTTQFPGIWQYDKSILDWLRTVQRMAGWSQFWNNDKQKGNGGWWQAANYDPSTADALPVGVPTTTTTTTATSLKSTVNSASPQIMAAALKEAQTETKQYEELVLRSSILLDATLFPVQSRDDASTDVFAYLAAHQGWDATTNAVEVELQIVKTCATEIALDYCTRVTTHKTTELVLERSGQGATLEELEAELETMIAKAEPYCTSIEACLQDDFATPACRAPVCPFENRAACSYLTSCFDDQVQRDYARAMELTLPAKTSV